MMLLLRHRFGQDRSRCRDEAPLGTAVSNSCRLSQAAAAAVAGAVAVVVAAAVGVAVGDGTEVDWVAAAVALRAELSSLAEKVAELP